jgi:flagellar hook-length control protein FliK
MTAPVPPIGNAPETKGTSLPVPASATNGTHALMGDFDAVLACLFGGGSSIPAVAPSASGQSAAADATAMPGSQSPAARRAPWANAQAASDSEAGPSPPNGAKDIPKDKAHELGQKILAAQAANGQTGAAESNLADGTAPPAPQGDQNRMPAAANRTAALKPDARPQPSPAFPAADGPVSTGEAAGALALSALIPAAPVQPAPAADGASPTQAVIRAAVTGAAPQAAIPGANMPVPAAPPRSQSAEQRDNRRSAPLGAEAFLKALTSLGQPQLRPAPPWSGAAPQTQDHGDPAPADSATDKQSAARSDANQGASTPAAAQTDPQPRAAANPPAHNAGQTSSQNLPPIAASGAAASAPVPQPDAQSASVPAPILAATLHAAPLGASAAASSGGDTPISLGFAGPGAANFDDLALRVAAKSAAGDSHFLVRLDPPELGRIDVNLNVDSQGAAHADVSASEPKTLDLLQRDAPALERALRDAGVALSGGMSFSLKGGGSGQGRNFAPSSRARGLRIGAINATGATSLIAASAIAHTVGGLRARLDITV